MALTAEDLCKSIRLFPALRETIRDQCTAIDDRLKQMPMVLGTNCLVHELPTRIQIRGLSLEKAQTIVYSAILRSLVNRKFDVRISLEDHKTLLYVRWFTELSAAEDDAMVALIKAYRIRPDEAPAFMAGKGGPASSAGRPGAAKPFSLAGPARRPPLHRGGTAAPLPPPPPPTAQGGPSAAEIALLGEPPAPKARRGAR